MTANAALIGGLVGGACLLLLIAALVGLVFLRGRERDRLEQALSSASAPPSQYSALPPARLYDDVTAVQRPANQYDSPTSVAAVKSPTCFISDDHAAVDVSHIRLRLSLGRALRFRSSSRVSERLGRDATIALCAPCAGDGEPPICAVRVPQTQ
jgi:hypothetical protein